MQYTSRNAWVGAVCGTVSGVARMDVLPEGWPGSIQTEGQYLGIDNRLYVWHH